MISGLKDSVDTRRRLFQKAILRWVSVRLLDYPWRKPGQTPYEILIAELLLKRTTATAAARVYDDFLYRFPSLKAINDTAEEELAHVLSKVGLQRQRAKAIKDLAYHLCITKGGDIPCDLNQLLEVPGLGEYSARAILSFGFGIPMAVVDANVERILGRVFQRVLPHRSQQSALQELAGLLVPVKSHKKYNLGLLDLGALICRYVNPLCEECPLKSLCDYNNWSKWRLVKEEPGRYATDTGAKLRKVRKEKGIGLARLAQLSGVSKLTIINIEAKRTNPTLKTLAKLASALGVKPDALNDL
jgi:A/G-specific adenine glycosylase